METQEVIGILISITAFSSYINYKFVKLPKSIGITLVTLVLSLSLVVCGKFGWGLDHLSLKFLHGVSFNETFLHGMLSFLLFAGALHINVYELAKHKFLITLLATVSVIFSTILIGYAMYGVSYCLSLKIPLSYCFVFGSLISPTDPIAVLGILKSVKAPKSLELKIAGESLFNDGMGIVLFFISLGFATGSSNDFSAKDISLYFVQQGLGGIILGSILGFITAKLIKTINDYDVVIIITLALVTSGYTFAHSILHVSGPICIVVAGLIIGASINDSIMSKNTLNKLHSFWALVDEIFNSILFVLIGLEFLRLNFDLQTGLAALASIGICIAARLISISIPVICMSKFKKPNGDLLLLMTWGGLRGGISIALALSVSGMYYNFIVAITYAVVLFSMLVQGLTMSPLLRSVISSGSAKKSCNVISKKKVIHK